MSDAKPEPKPSMRPVLCYAAYLAIEDDITCADFQTLSRAFYDILTDPYARREMLRAFAVDKLKAQTEPKGTDSTVRMLSK